MTLPHHMAITALLDKGQFEACRLMAQEFIAQQMVASQPDDLELAYLHLVLCRALLGVHEYELAAEKADVAVFLAMKSKDDVLLEEARYRAGTSYGRAADYRTAIRRFTDCLTHTRGKLQAEAYFGRGLAYDVLGAHSYASADYRSAIQLLSPDKTQLGRKARLNLAWVLILQRKFGDAETMLAQLEAAPGAEEDRLLQAQIAHDRIHMAHLKGENNSAFIQAVAALGQLGQDYPHVRAHVAVTLLAMAARRTWLSMRSPSGSWQSCSPGAPNAPTLTKRQAGRFTSCSARPEPKAWCSRSPACVRCSRGRSKVAERQSAGILGESVDWLPHREKGDFTVRKKMIGVLMGILLVGLLSGTALAGREWFDSPTATSLNAVRR